MTELVWDQIGERLYETGVDHGVLYLPDSQGAYVDGVAWNGLVNVSESPTGAEANAQYADNIKYLNLFSTEEFEGTIEAFTYPNEFAQFDGLATPTPGVQVGQQNRKTFGLSYRTLLGNDLEGTDYGYKLHLVYGCQVSPSERAYQTVNDSPEAITFSWELTTTPVGVSGLKPTALLTVNSTEVDGTDLAALEQILYGDTGVDPALPTPDSVISMFSGGTTIVTPTQPAFDDVDTITIPSISGVTYYVDSEAVPSGALVISDDTLVTARPNAGYVFTEGVDDDWFYVFAG